MDKNKKPAASIDPAKAKKKKRAAIAIAAMCAICVVGMFFMNSETLTFDFLEKTETDVVQHVYSADGVHRISLWDPDWETDIFERGDWLDKTRFVTYVEGGMEITIVDDDHAAYGEPVAMFADYFDALMHGDAALVNSFYSDAWLAENNGGFTKITMQKLYDMKVEYLSRVDNKSAATTDWYYKISYKIMENDGTFRNDIPSDAVRAQYYTVHDNGYELEITYVGYQSPLK